MGLTCADVMVSPERQLTIHPEESVAKAFEIIRTTGVRFLPVVDDDGKYLGVFTAPTLLKLFLPKAALLSPVGAIDKKIKNKRGHLNNLSFMSLSEEDFHAQLEGLRHEKVGNNLSEPKNIPVVPPDTPIMEGIFLIYQYKRHVVLVDPDTGKFVGMLSANSVLRNILDEPQPEEPAP